MSLLGGGEPRLEEGAGLTRGSREGGEGVTLTSRRRRHRSRTLPLHPAQAGVYEGGGRQSTAGHVTAHPPPRRQPQLAPPFRGGSRKLWERSGRAVKASIRRSAGETGGPRSQEGSWD